MATIVSSLSPRKISFILVGLSIVLALSASAIGIDDNLPGILLALLASTAFVLAFVHSWRTSRKFLFILLPVSVVGTVLFLILNIAFESLTLKPGASPAFVSFMESPIADAVNVAIYMLLLAAFLVGVVGSIIFAIRKPRQVKKIIGMHSGEEAIMAVDNLLSPIYYSKPEKLTDQEKTIVFIEELEREVNNGGFYQFFLNSSGDHTDEVINALKNIGSTVNLRLIESAVKQFPNSNIPKDITERRNILNSIGDGASQIWSELDAEFYKHVEDITSLMLDYIQKNINKFR